MKMEVVCADRNLGGETGRIQVEYDQVIFA